MQFLDIPVTDVSKVSGPAFYIPVVLKIGRTVYMNETVFETCRSMLIVFETVSENQLDTRRYPACTLTILMKDLTIL